MTAFTVNPARGEVLAAVAGEPRRLCLTLGALAEIEGALALCGPGELAARLREPRAADLVAVLAALLRGGGEDPACAAAATPREAAEAVALAFVAAG